MCGLSLAKSRVTSLTYPGHSLSLSWSLKLRSLFFFFISFLLESTNSQVVSKTLCIYQSREIYFFFFLFAIHLTHRQYKQPLSKKKLSSSFFFSVSCKHTPSKTHTNKNLRCSKSYAPLAQLYSGVKTALDVNPCGHSLASISMQHKAEAQRTTLREYHTGIV